jgi:hypothetical protein
MDKQEAYLDNVCNSPLLVPGAKVHRDSFVLFTDDTFQGDLSVDINMLTCQMARKTEEHMQVTLTTSSTRAKWQFRSQTGYS